MSDKDILRKQFSGIENVFSYSDKGFIVSVNDEYFIGRSNDSSFRNCVAVSIKKHLFPLFSLGDIQPELYHRAVKVLSHLL